MKERPAFSTGPISFTTTLGQQVFIPLPDLYYDTSGTTLRTDRYPASTHPEYAQLAPYLSRLMASGALFAGPESSAKPAFKATALTVGSTGLLITIAISKVMPDNVTPANSLADFTVTETETFTGLTKDTLIPTLGSSGNTASILFVSSAGPKMPDTGSTVILTTTAGNPWTADIKQKDGTTIAFSLTSRGKSDASDATATKVTATISAVTATTFTLTVSYTKTITAQSITAQSTSFSMILTIVPVPPAGSFLAPAEGTITLVGGSDGLSIATTPASAVALSSP